MALPSNRPKAARFVRAAALVIGVLALVSLIASFPVLNSYKGKSQLVQRVQKDDAGELFGESVRLVGSPQQLIIQDSKAFLEDAPPTGPRLVDEDYLRKSGEYPLQLKTVEYVGGLVQLGSGIALAVSLLAFWFASRRKVAEAA